MPALCLECCHRQQNEAENRCENCHSPRILSHPELDALSIAHVDCDAFYAAIEKRDNPDLANAPVIIGGGKRGVVSTACYIARTYGVHSAQPMFKALKACPDAVVLPPNLQKYSEVGRQIKDLMKELTPLVQSLSIDEAFLDLTGTERLHRYVPAETLLHFSKHVEKEIGITVSIGLSYCKFLAKIASDLNKPRGYSVIGRAEAVDFLARQPVSVIWGVGKSFQASLARDGIHKIGQLQKMDEKDLAKRYGVIGLRLAQLARGEDSRVVSPNPAMKSISAETTFEHALSRLEDLEKALWPLCEKLSARTKKSALAGSTVILKLRTDGFRIVTRNKRLDRPTQLAEVLYRAGRELLKAEADGTRYRLIGIGLSRLCDAGLADQPDLLLLDHAKQVSAERAIDHVREKYGDAAIFKGRKLK